MNDINSLVIVGRITSDCEFGYLNSGSAKASFSIAVNRSKKDGDQWVDEASFFPITVWGKTAENLHTRFVKGQQVIISGYLKQDRWEKDGQKQSATKIIVENIQLGSGGNGGNNGENNNGGKPVFKPKENGAPAEENINYENGDFSEDIPF